MKSLISILILLTTLLGSCNNSKEKNIAKLVSEWQSKKIIFPTLMTFTRFATDTINYQIPDTQYKILVYIDSNGCTSCKLQLSKWKELISHIDSINNKKTPFLIFFHSKDYKTIRYLLKSEKFDLPVCIDSNDQLNKLNKFPNDINFQTFLLNRNNDIVIIGNPIHNSEIKDLYIKEITGLKNYNSNYIMTNAKLVSNKIDFGSFKRSEIKETIFTIENTGKNPLVVVDISTTCGCTAVSYEKRPTKPGEILQVGIKMTPKNTGFFDETVTVKCNIEKPIKFKIRGNVL